MTGQALTRPVALTPNVALRHSIEDWAQQHAIFLLVGAHLTLDHGKLQLSNIGNMRRAVGCGIRFRAKSQMHLHAAYKHCCTALQEEV